jgi:hypothetical protein
MQHPHFELISVAISVYYLHWQIGGAKSRSEIHIYFCSKLLKLRQVYLKHILLMLMYCDK